MWQPSGAMIALFLLIRVGTTTKNFVNEFSKFINKIVFTTNDSYSKLKVKEVVKTKSLCVFPST